MACLIGVPPVLAGMSPIALGGGGPGISAAAATTCGPGWTADNPPPVGSLQSLTGVAAVAGGDAFAVGYGIPGHNLVDRPLAEMWSGASWSSVPVQLVTSGASQFNAVAMSGSADGWAVGWSEAKDKGAYQTLAEQWNGSAWNAVATPNVGPGDNLLVSDATISPTEAWAVGYSTGTVRQTLAERWDGASWSVVPSPNVGSGANTLLGVTATASNDVWAVGYSTAASGYLRTLIEHFDGTSWTVVTTPSSGPVHEVLTSVTATGPNDAWAAGYQTTVDGQYHALIEHWDGSAWTVPSLPASTDRIDALRGIAARSPSDAWAVGSRLDPVSGSYVGFTLHWDGTSWSASLPSTAKTELRAVTSEPGAAQWWAVGVSIAQPLAYQLCEATTAAAPAAVLQSRTAPAGAGGGVSPQITSFARSTPLQGAPTSGSTLPTAAPAEQVYATDVAASTGLPATSDSAASVVADFGNGHPDIFLSGNATNGGSSGALYMNDGSGHLTMIDGSSFPSADRRSCDTADVSGNGMTDIFCAVGAQNGNSMKADNLFVEGPNYSFTDQAAAFGVGDPFTRGGSATFVNGSNGLPDLFVGATPTRSDGIPAPNRFYVNTGHGFQDAPQFGLDQEIGSHCATHGDFNGDGFDDLLLCSSTGMHLYQSDGGTGFTDVTAAVGLPSSRGVQDAIFTDLNGDGLLDVVVVTTDSLLVYLQNPGHTFTQSYSMRLTGGVSVAAGDVNGDSVPDLYVVEGRSGSVSNEPDLMLLNNGSGTAFAPMTIPEVTAGKGSRADPIGFEGNGLTDFLVFNDMGAASPAPLQLIAFSPVVAPGITSPDTATVARNAPVDFSVTTVGSPTPSITETGALPPGVSFTDNGNGTASLSGTTSSVGSFPITFGASNGFAPDATQSFTLTVDRRPTVTSVSPPVVAVGATVPVTVTGTGFDPGATVTLRGPTPGVRASQVTVVDATTITARITASVAAAPGEYSVRVADPDGLDAKCTTCFSVIPAPSLTAISPPDAALGTRLPVTLTGTGFAPGAVVHGPSGVGFGSVVVVNSTTITAVMRVSATAPTGTGLPITVVNDDADGHGRAVGDLLTLT